MKIAVFLNLRLLIVVLSFTLPILSVAQSPNEAKFEYELAEESFNKGNRATAIAHLDKAVALLKGSNPKIDFFRINILSDSLFASTIDPERPAILMPLTIQLIDLVNTYSKYPNLPEDKEREAFTLRNRLNDFRRKINESQRGLDSAKAQLRRRFENYHLNAVIRDQKMLLFFLNGYTPNQKFDNYLLSAQYSNRDIKKINTSLNNAGSTTDGYRHKGIFFQVPVMISDIAFPKTITMKGPGGVHYLSKLQKIGVSEKDATLLMLNYDFKKKDDSNITMEELINMFGAQPDEQRDFTVNHAFYGNVKETSCQWYYSDFNISAQTLAGKTISITIYRHDKNLARRIGERHGITVNGNRYSVSTEDVINKAYY